MSHSREKQIVTWPNSIYSNKQKIEYKKFNLIKNTRSLIKEEIIHTMYPVKVMDSLDKDIEMENFSVNDYISSESSSRSLSAMATEYDSSVTRLGHPNRVSHHRIIFDEKFLLIPAWLYVTYSEIVASVQPKS